MVNEGGVTTVFATQAHCARNDGKRRMGKNQPHRRTILFMSGRYPPPELEFPGESDGIS